MQAVRRKGWVAMAIGGVEETVSRARVAQAEVEYWSQAQVDEMVLAVGWACYQPRVARTLSDQAHAETGMGDPGDLFTLHRRRILGTLRDLHGARTVGVVEDQPALGVRKLAKPLGVIAVASPATAPCSGVICNALPMLKTRNAVVFSPNPRARHAVRAAVEIMREALEGAGAPADLLQCLPDGGRAATEALMSACDRVVAAGGVGTLERAGRSGTPAISAAVGNSSVVVDETADLAAAAEKVVFGGSFNNGTSCSSESNLLVEENVADAFAAELRRFGAHVCDEAETARLRELLWTPGRVLDRAWIGTSAAALAAGAQIATGQERSLLVATAPAVDVSDPLFGEKLAPVVSLTTYRSFPEAVETVMEITDACGRGHSCAIHSRRPDRVMALAERVRLCRVMVNQSTAVGNSGSFDNGLPFTSTIASGSWGGCVKSENITWRDFVNYTCVSRPIPPRTPTEEEIFGRYWSVGDGALDLVTQAAEEAGTA